MWPFASFKFRRRTEEQVLLRTIYQRIAEGEARMSQALDNLVAVEAVIGAQVAMTNAVLATLKTSNDALKAQVADLQAKLDAALAAGDTSALEASVQSTVDRLAVDAKDLKDVTDSVNPTPAA